MKLYSYLLKALVFTILITFGACTDEFIDKPIQPGTESDASFRKTPDGLLYTVNASYAPLFSTWWMGYSLNRTVLGNLKSDDAQKGAESADDDLTEQAINDFNIFSTNNVVKEFWRIAYVGVHYANAVIESAPSALSEATQADAALINNYVGEAKCLRAFYYFELVKEFGDLPLLLSATSQALIPRSGRLLVYDQIQKDLTEASQVLLPANKLAPANKGRMSSGAALALLAKVYAFRASLEPVKANEYFTLAHQTAKKVIDSKQFTLLPTYNAVWKQTGDFSSEGIIEGGQPDATVSYTDGSYFGIYQAPRYYYTGKKNANGLNIKGPASAYGWGFITPTQDFVDAFEKGDPRLNWSVFVQGDSCNVGVSSKKINQLICFDHSPTGYYLRKYVPDGYPVNGALHLNIKYFRYSDLILIGAEAANEIGNSGDALAWLEIVRDRARKTPAAPYHAADKIAGVPVQITETNKDELRKIIQNERRVELGIEDHRFYDLVRWDGQNGFSMKVAIETGQFKTGPNYQIDSDEKSGTPRKPHLVLVEPKHKLSPIPDVEIKTSGNSLTQNEGY